MKTEHYEAIAEKIHHLTDDIRIEVLLAELIENEKLEFRQKSVKTQGLFSRDYRREIDRIEIEKDDQFNVFRKMAFFIWREGLYDSLPKGIFHSLRKEKQIKTLEQTQKDLKDQEAEKEAARVFFHPVEQEFYNHRILLELQERAALSGFRENTEARAFAREIWGLDTSGIDHEKMIPLLFFLPFTFQYKGQMNKLDEIFSIILKNRVRFEQCWGVFSKAGGVDLAALGTSFLGENLVLGDQFMDGIPVLQVVILELTAEETVEYLPGKGQSALLNILKSFFLPADAEVETVLEIADQEKDFRLGNQNEKGQAIFNNYLGYTTFISI